MSNFHKYIDITIPVEACNFRCHYCYIWQCKNMDRNNSVFKYEASHVAQGLSKKRLGGTCLINICGIGETLFSQYTIDLTKGLLEHGHFVIIVTNGCAQDSSYEQLANFPENLKKRLLIKFSFHYLELKRLGLFDKYWEHVHQIKKSGCSISIEFCPSDEAIPYKNDIKTMCLHEVGALPHVTNARINNSCQLDLMTKLSVDEYKAVWGDFDSDMFDVKIKSYACPRKEFCYAGLWSAYLNAGTGQMWQCHGGTQISSDIFKDINKPLTFRAVGVCKAPYCVNAHCGMCMGCLPDLDVQTFCSTRDRVCSDGTHWLSPEWIKFSSQKLYDNNARFCAKKENRLGKSLSKKHHSLWWHICHLKF